MSKKLIFVCSLCSTRWKRWNHKSWWSYWHLNIDCRSKNYSPLKDLVLWKVEHTALQLCMPSPWRSLCSVKYWVHIPHSTIQFLFQPSFCKPSEGHFHLDSHLGSHRVPGQAHGVEHRLTRVKRSSETIMNNAVTLTNWSQFCCWSRILNFVIDHIHRAIAEWIFRLLWQCYDKIYC